VVFIGRYILRRAKEGFRSNRSANVEEATKLVALAEKEFEVAQRQSILYGMYGRKVKNVLVSSQGLSCSLRMLGSYLESEVARGCNWYL
jgi:hypothetical protein